jgi:hypothetical protein
MLGQGECPYSSNSISNQYLNSIIEEHLGDENDLKHSNILMKLIRDIDLQLEEEILNPQSYLIHKNYQMVVVKVLNYLSYMREI